MHMRRLIDLVERTLAQTETPAFKAWFGNSKIVDPSGRPLICYHGTSRDFDRFQGHGHESIYRGDGEELKKADSWDMGDDYQGMPDAYHYGALSDALTLGAKAAYDMRAKEGERYKEAPSTQRHLGDLRRLMAYRKITIGPEMRPNQDAFWFTPSHLYGYISRAHELGDGANVMPVYLSIQNPKWVNSAAIESAGRSYRVEQYRQQGFDGAIFANDPADLTKEGFEGSTQIVAFDPHQIKSALANNGQFDPANPRITESD